MVRLRRHVSRFFGSASASAARWLAAARSFCPRPRSSAAARSPEDRRSDFPTRPIYCKDVAGEVHLRLAVGDRDRAGGVLFWRRARIDRICLEMLLTRFPPVTTHLAQRNL